jgi:hypothetical protein
MARLKCETETGGMMGRVLAAFHACVPNSDIHPLIAAVFERGQWWITCDVCRARWSVGDAEGPGSVDGFAFRRAREGDEYCLDNYGDHE